MFVLDRPGAAQFFAALARPLVARLAASGGPPPGGLTIAMVGAAAAVHATGFVAPLTEDAGLPFRFVPVPATLPLPEIAARLEELRAPALYGYASVIARLAVERRAGRLRLDPAFVTCTSETLTPSLRAVIANSFGVAPSNAFGSTEGLVGAGRPGEEELTFAEDGCVIELVDADRRPVPPGTRRPRCWSPTWRTASSRSPLRAGRLVRGDGRPWPPAGEGLRPQRRAVPLRAGCAAPAHGAGRAGTRAGGAGVPGVPDRTGDRPRRRRLRPGAGLPALAARLESALADAGLPHPRAEVRAVPRIERDPTTAKLRLFVPLPR